MTLSQYGELLEYIAKNNCWGDNMYNINITRNRKAIKYVDASFDTRDGRVWKVEFRDVTGEPDKTFGVADEDGLKQIYAWLDAPLNQ